MPGTPSSRPPTSASVAELATPAGHVLRVHTGETDDVVARLLRDGAYGYEPPLALLLDLVRPTSVVLDVGAHLGTFALAAAASGARVLAVEANPTNAELLAASAADNHLDVEVVCALVGRAPAEVAFLADGAWSRVVPPGTAGATGRQVVTVDSLLAERSFTPDLVKIDVEGSEVEVLAGMEAVLAAEPPPVVVAEGNGHALGLLGFSPADLLAAVSRAGWRAWRIEAAGRLVEVGEHPQLATLVDYLVLREGRPLPAGWSAVAEREAERVAVVTAEAAHPNPDVRAHLARTLAADAARSLREHGRVRSALGRLAEDPDRAVRTAAGWWTPPAAPDARPGLLDRARRRLGALAAVDGPASDQVHHNKVCNLEDFARPEIARVIRRILPHELRRFGLGFPLGAEYRKHWEFAMAVRALGDLGALGPDTRILGVAAGNEPTIFHLTLRAGQVFATDLYLDPGVWQVFADGSMLVAPEDHWPGRFDRRRLVVQHMDALDLRYPDASFDGIFSSSSIEHFGELEDMEQAVREMHRVLKPGGICTVSTEYRLEGSSPGLPGCLMLDPDLIERFIVGDRDWALVDELDTTVSDATRASVVPNESYLAAWDSHLAERPWARWHELELPGFPQLVLRNGEHVFTSVHLALRKAG